MGAATVVTWCVPDYVLVMGNPATQVGWICRGRERLGHDMLCTLCGKACEQVSENVKVKSWHKNFLSSYLIAIVILSMSLWLFDFCENRDISFNKKINSKKL